MTRPWIALIGPEVEENLSLRYLASGLQRAGFAVDLVPFNAEVDLERCLRRVLDRETPPLLVGVSLAFQWRALDFLAFVLGLRQRGFEGHITAGGHFATFTDSELLTDFAELDTICRHEADETIVALAQALQDGEPIDELPGLALRGADGQILRTAPRPVPDLDSLAWPDRRGAPARCFGHGIAPLVGSRGCYADCSFCCIAAWHNLSPGDRWRLRDPDDVAAEMAQMHHHRGIDIFVFHDDNFFVARKRVNIERIEAIADGLERRGVRRFATVVKARPTDVNREVFEVLQRRLRCLRAYVGIETHSEQGLKTLRRWARPRQNDEAILILRELGILPCFNMLIFDPDTTLESLAENVDFMERNAYLPFNFCRTELYAGTPLLDRMRREGRAVGDWLRCGYDIIDPATQRVFELAMAGFRPRNFGDNPIANRMSGVRFDVAACRMFHADRFEPAWEEEAVALSRRLGEDTTARLRETIAYVRGPGAVADAARDAAHVESLGFRLRDVDDEVGRRADKLAMLMTAAVGGGQGIGKIGRREVTPLQASAEA